MWPTSYNDRLVSWNNLRDRSRQLPVDQSLQGINLWWQQTPWCPYSLHWDDQQDWPDPWELLADQSFCGLARGLGIVYTIMLIDHQEISEIELAEIDNDNLVLVNNGKYILNWDSNTILNINSADIQAKRIINSRQLKNRLG
jgi:hypothetical protein